jgi:hypothetical protein
MTHTLSVHMPLVALAAEADDTVGVTVEITPLESTCTVDCAAPLPPSLPVTGGEPLSILLPVALLVIGVVSVVVSRLTGRRHSA